MRRVEIDEYLEILWCLSEKEIMDLISIRRHIIEEQKEFDDSIIETLEFEGYVRLDGNNIKLTEKGENIATSIIRSHRLAERFMVDALGMKIHEIEPGACEFEHLLNREIVDSICTFLGHPRKCPHDKFIPQGRCCKEKKEIIHSGVISLDKAQAGEKYKVAYINTSHSRMHKLNQFGIKPGSEICLHQNHPSIVIMSENELVAIDKEIAQEICIWKNNGG